MRFGFTGTRRGMTFEQIDTCEKLLKRIHAKLPAMSLNHGDCVGADAEADLIAKYIGIVRYAWPSNVANTRSHSEELGAILASPESPPLLRDTWIVASSAFMIAAPATSSPILRSGTWSTCRFAWKASCRVFIIYPDGRLGVT
jgi:hypothetical protein